MIHRTSKHHRTPKNEYENGTCATGLDNGADGYARNSREDGKRVRSESFSLEATTTVASKLRPSSTAMSLAGRLPAMRLRLRPLHSMGVRPS
jgi:hypothetical protein